MTDKTLKEVMELAMLWCADTVRLRVCMLMAKQTVNIYNTDFLLTEG